ncbi:MAG: DUF1273 family protein [Clostridia bacterium]|nr:DUF1273 family protein [Clostridia bacterium]
MTREKTCLFTGHRHLGNMLDKTCLMRGIEYVISLGVDTFISGGALGFDTEASLAVLEAKKTYPNIKLFIFAPCKNQSNGWSFSEKALYKKILKKADFVDMPDYDYFNGCMKARNYKMVDSSSYCIAFFDGNGHSGTGQTYNYAKRSGLTVYNIYGKN